MELRAAQTNEIAAMRETRRRGLSLGLVPGFYDRLVGEAAPHLIVERGGDGFESRILGYVLLLERPHDGHMHVTVLEAHLEPDQHARYEEVLDLLRDEKTPTSYLARTDDCLYDATLLARGLQVEPTALVLLADGRPASGRAPADDRGSLELVALSPAHLAGLRALVESDGASATGAHTHEHRHELSQSEMLAELEQMAASGRDWVLMDGTAPVAVVARADGGDGVHEVLDIALGMAAEADLAWALRRAGEAITRAGLRPAAVIDALETTRHRLFRAAGFHTAAVYLVFYDPDGGRPSVARVTTEELRALLKAGEGVRLLDVMGEEHWRAGHIPGAEWIDFRGLAREARRRFRSDEPLILYCNGFT